MLLQNIIKIIVGACCHYHIDEIIQQNRRMNVYIISNSNMLSKRISCFGNFQEFPLTLSTTFVMTQFTNFIKFAYETKNYNQNFTIVEVLQNVIVLKEEEVSNNLE